MEEIENNSTSKKYSTMIEFWHDYFCVEMPCETFHCILETYVDNTT